MLYASADHVLRKVLCWENEESEVERLKSRLSELYYMFKRNRPVTLSKTKKKGREQKEKIVDSIRKAVEDYNSIYVFSFENMRNLKFKEFREQIKSSSRFFLGLNKVMQISLGRSVSDEIKPGLHKVSKLLRGDVGLCFTNLPKEEIMRLFAEFEEHDFARTGTTSTEKVELQEGPLEQFSHEMEPFLRKQGMPVRLNKGVIELVSDFVICEEGKPLSPEASRILVWSYVLLYNMLISPKQLPTLPAAY